MHVGGAIGGLDGPSGPAAVARPAARGRTDPMARGQDNTPWHTVIMPA
jgi:hypothetical protein